MDRITHGFFPSSVLRCVSKDSRRLSGACGRRTSRGGWTNGTTARTHSEGSIRSARLRWLELTWRNAAEDDTCSGETSEQRHTQPGWHLQQLAACVHKPDTLNQISIDVFLWRKERSHFYNWRGYLHNPISLIAVDLSVVVSSGAFLTTRLQCPSFLKFTRHFCVGQQKTVRHMSRPRKLIVSVFCWCLTKHIELQWIPTA